MKRTIFTFILCAIGVVIYAQSNYQLAKETNNLLNKMMYGKEKPQEVLFSDYPSFKSLVKKTVTNSKHYELMEQCWLFDSNEWMEFDMGKINAYTQVVRETKMYSPVKYELEFMDYMGTSFSLTIKFYIDDELEATYQYESE